MSDETEITAEKLQEKYSLNLDLQTKIGEQTYWDLRNFFVNELKEDHILIDTSIINICCHRTDVESIKKDFNKQLAELIKEESGPCSDPYKVGCQASDSEEDN